MLIVEYFIKEAYDEPRRRGGIMKKEIQAIFLDEARANYEKDDLQKVMRHALFENGINAVTGIQEQQQNVKNDFSINIDTMPVTNQMASGRCWIFAGLNIMRERVAKKLNIEHFELSQNYTAFYDKLEKINFFMESVMELADRPWDDRTLTWILETGIGDGGQWDMLTAVIEKYGVVPKDAMPETYISSHTSEMRDLLNRKLRQFANDVKACSQKEAMILKEKTLVQLYNFLCTCYGVPPKQFSFSYTDKDKQYHCIDAISPKQFFKQYVDMNFDDYVSIIHAPTQDKPFHEVYSVKYLGNVIDKKVSYLNLDLPAFKKCIMDQLKDKELVWFGSDCGKFGDRTKGYWDVDAFDYETPFQMNFNMSKEAMLNSRESAMNHAMVFTGLNLEETRPTRWKIENSWGDEKAHKGYYVASDAWFDMFVYQGVVQKKYLSKDAIDALQKQPHLLEPWDPMGTLAD